MPPKSQIDPAWEYATRAEGTKDGVICKLCSKQTNGGITRFKQHIVGGFRNASMCPKTTPEIRGKFRAMLEAAKEKRNNRNAFSIPSQDSNDFDMSSGHDAHFSGTQTQSTTNNFARGPMDKFMSGAGGSKSSNDNLQQTNVNAHFKKEQRTLACRQFCRWLYQAGIPFNTLRLNSFKEAMNTISQFGPGFKPPSYHEARVTFLKMEVEHTETLMAHHKQAWEKYECSIMSDGWSDGKRRHLINFLVHSPAGTMFIKSVDASCDSIDRHVIFEYLKEVIEEVGPKNVVQIVTDNASNYTAAKQMLKVIYPHIFMSPCAAHCLDLALEDITKQITLVKRTLSKAQMINVFIYNHGSVLHLLRESTNGKELVKPAVTRFATAFLTVQSIFNERDNLRQMFTSERWLKNKLSKTRTGKKVCEIILSTSFWKNIQVVMSLCVPIVSMLRMVDGDEPTMGYMFDAYLRAKDMIMKVYQNDRTNLKMAEKVCQILTARWDDMMYNELYLTGMFLNPSLFFGTREFVQNDEEVNSVVLRTLRQMVQNDEQWTEIVGEIATYRLQERSLGSAPARAHMHTMHPARWWMNYGSSAPKLQAVAIRILNLTTSSSGCERNWSIFQHLHSKRRNRLEQKRLNDMVYVKYNQLLHERRANHTLDPLLLDDIDDCNEWIANLNLDSENAEEGLTWGMIEMAAGLLDDEEGPSTRATRKDKGKTRVDFQEVEVGLLDEDDEDGDPDNDYDVGTSDRGDGNNEPIVVEDDDDDEDADDVDYE